VLAIAVFVSTVDAGVEGEIVLASLPQGGKLMFEHGKRGSDSGTRGGLCRESHPGKRFVGLEQGRLLCHKGIKPGL
jgi:hypothetical protein